MESVSIYETDKLWFERKQNQNRIKIGSLRGQTKELKEQYHRWELIMYVFKEANNNQHIHWAQIEEA